MRFSFPKQEKLKSLKAFEVLFSSGESDKHYPVRMVFIPWPTGDAPVQAGFSVSKKRFRKAVDRNRIKRMMREAYRLQKPEYLGHLHKQYAVVFIYLHHRETAMPQLMHAIANCLKSLVEFDNQVQNSQ